MWHLGVILGKPFDWLLAAFEAFGRFPSLAVVSLLASVVLLFGFRWLSDQDSLGRARSRVKAHLLELRLFRHDVRVVWAAQKKVFWYNLVCFKHLLKPLVVTLPVFAWFLIELESWFELRPVRPGEAVVVSVFLDQSRPEMADGLSVRAGEGLRVETPGLRIPEERRVDWRVRAVSPGDHRLEFATADGLSANKLIRVARAGLTRVSPILDAGFSFATLQNTMERPLPRDCSICRIEVDYPEGGLEVLGWDINWIAAFVVFSLAFAFVLKRPMGVTL